jgi:hypothetical protein
VFSRDATNTNLIVFGFIWPGLKSMILNRPTLDDNVQEEHSIEIMTQDITQVCYVFTFKYTLSKRQDDDKKVSTLVVLWCHLFPLVSIFVNKLISGK